MLETLASQEVRIRFSNFKLSKLERYWPVIGAVSRVDQVVYSGFANIAVARSMVDQSPFILKIDDNELHARSLLRIFFLPSRYFFANISLFTGQTPRTAGLNGQR